MKNSMLRAPIIKSAVLLIFLSLIIYLTVTSPEGSLWSSIGIIFYTIFKAAQLAIGLVLALLVCFAVLVGIFFGCVAMISTESAAAMFAQFRQFIRNQYEPFIALIGKKGEQTQSSIPDYSSRFKELEKSQEVMVEKILALQDRVEQTEQDESITKLSDWLRAEEEKAGKVQASMEMFDRQLDQLKEQVESMTAKLEIITSSPTAGEVNDKVIILTQSNDVLASEMKELKERVGSLATDFSEFRADLVESETQEDEEHRLFSYIDDSVEIGKIQKLVADALSQEMTYAQVIEHVKASVASKIADILAEHPSLTKDYIKECRKKTLDDE